MQRAYVQFRPVVLVADVVVEFGAVVGARNEVVERGAHGPSDTIAA